MSRTKSEIVPEANGSDSKANLDLREFESGRPLDRQLAALTQLIKVRKIHAALHEPQFEHWIERLAEIATYSDDPVQRMRAVAALTRMSAVAKALRTRAVELFREALMRPLPAFDVLPNPDDRLYVAQACGLTTASWCASYLANAAVTEDSAEKVRLECFRSLLKLTPSLHVLLETLRDALASFTLSTNSSADSVAKRLRRIFAALRQAIGPTIVEPGPAAGAMLADVARVPFRNLSARPISKMSSGLAEETVALVHELIRARFSLAIDAETYKTLRVARSWLDFRWEKFARVSKSTSLVRQDLREAIAILAKQGKTDDELAAALETACGSPREARNIMARIGQEIPGLSECVRSWLMHAEQKHPERTIINNEARFANESREISEAMDLADLILSAQEMIETATSIREVSPPQLGEVENTLANRLGTLIARAEAMANVVNSFGKRRSLEIRGQVGDEVEYSPNEHDMVGGPSTGIRWVRIRRPAVVYVRVDSVPIIVRKAVVGPIEKRNARPV
jgi:hypothetical protein